MKIAYLVDTNVLHDWLFSYIPQVKQHDAYFNPKKAARIRDFMENNENPVYIPDLVWSEFLGVTLHKEMDVSASLNELKLHFRLLLGVIQQMELKIHENEHLTLFTTQSEKLGNAPFTDGAELVMDPGLIDENLFAWMKRSGQKKGGKEKLLDGMDAAIVFYLDGLAACHPEYRMMLFTGDFRIVRAFGRIRSHWKRFGFSQNTGAVFSFSEQVRTRTGNHPITLMRTARVNKVGLF
ncbi:hypothetical protein [Methylotuvimicrobium sp. KM2]|uniref:hypothetical protein n=1 Tax=Methylotuvimicrobium sp. KM2 TaxID=3133976 RepID=UPI003100EA6C